MINYQIILIDEDLCEIENDELSYEFAKQILDGGIVQFKDEFYRVIDVESHPGGIRLIAKRGAIVVLHDHGAEE